MKAVAFDLDDTLLRNDLSISDYAIDTLFRLYTQGIHIIPASGRAQLSMKPFVEQMKGVSLYISCNGAEIWDGRSHQLLYQELFSAELGREIAQFGNRYSCYSQTYSDSRFFYSEESEWADKYAASSMLTGEYVGNLYDYIREPRCKILMMAEENRISAMLADAKNIFRGRASVTCSKPYFLEFNPINATKGNALKRVADFLNISVSDIIAFGDSLNDLPMLQIAGRSVVMANGRDDVKPLCDDICGSNEEDGVAHYLDNFFFGGLSC